MSERQEYTRDTYPSFGKRYNGEKAIISLTSWKARINTVSKTLYSLIKQCPGFHIVLVLSEEEFPKMMDELPKNLNLFVDNELIEVLWVYKNYKAFKKWAFTSDKYRDVPIISADDDCIYTCNYAQIFYNKWLKENKKKNSIRWSNYKEFIQKPSGASHLYYMIPNAIAFIKSLSEKIINKSDDDELFGQYFRKIKLNCGYITNNSDKPFLFHDEINALHNFKKIDIYKKCYGEKC